MPTALGAHSLVGVPHVDQSWQLPVRDPWGPGAGYRNPMHYVIKMLMNK